MAAVSGSADGPMSSSTETFAPVAIKVWGDFACFTRPEAKVERVSYEVMTPSAARGILEAIFWKPEFQWRVREIHVLRPIRFFSIRRNEVSTRLAPSTVRGWAERGGNYYAEDDRAQRHTLALRDVAYLIWADVAVRPGVEEHPAKFRDQFRRRVERGQRYHAPCLGTREFAASFGPPQGDERPIPLTTELGLMLFDLDYAEDGSGRGTPRFFEARLAAGVLRVPIDLYAPLRAREKSHAAQATQ